MPACAEAAFCASVVDTYSPLTEYLFRAICDDDPVGNDRPVRMSAREAEVLDALGAHLSNAQIARRLHFSVRTVESHVASPLRKLGAADRRELAGLAAVTRPTAAPLNLPAPRLPEATQTLAATVPPKRTSGPPPAWPGPPAGCPRPPQLICPLRHRQIPAPTQEGLPYSCRHGASWKRMPSVYRAPDRTTETPCRTGAAVKPRTERIGRSRVVNTSPRPWGSAIAVPRD
jgi:DNA-binding CsgD family transcriptional regulator